jgi:hypothetical protein
VYTLLSDDDKKKGLKSIDKAEACLAPHSIHGHDIHLDPLCESG